MAPDQIAWVLTAYIVAAAIAKAYDMSTLSGAAFLDSTVTHQASMIAYIDDFWLMLFLTLGVTPLLLLIRPPGRNAALRPTPMRSWTSGTGRHG